MVYNLPSSDATILSSYLCVFNLVNDTRLYFIFTVNFHVYMLTC